MIYNAKYVWAGVVVFLGIFTLPFTLNLCTEKFERPAITLPQGVTDCIAPVEYMRSSHMDLLNTWRDQALRSENREYVDHKGRKWVVSLQNTCQQCHANKAEFCDRCHLSNSVHPYCWECHVEPKGNL